MGKKRVFSLTKKAFQRGVVSGDYWRRMKKLGFSFRIQIMGKGQEIDQQEPST